VIVGGAASVAYSQGVPPGQPFQQLQTLVNALAAQVTQLSSFVSGLATQVTNLETAVAALQSSGGGATRTVIAGTIDLNSAGDVVRDNIESNGQRVVRHFAKFGIADLTADDPPTITLFRRTRTDGTLTTTGFITAGLGNQPFTTVFPNGVPTPSNLDATVIIVEDGQILVQFRTENFNPPSAPTPTAVRYGLDGPGGTGDYRLVLVR
jgi:hypothetical protein